MARRRASFAAMGLLATALVGGLISLSGIAAAAEHSTPPKAVTKTLPPPFVNYDSFDAGMAISTIQVFNKAGQLILYGDSDVLYRLPPKFLGGELATTLGGSLYQQNCSACHGVHANGIPKPGIPGGAFPDLLGLGPATYDFWIESGRMPAVNTADTQAGRRPARLDQVDALAISAYLNSLQPATPYIPDVNLKGASLSEGEQLFALNCAACHTITGDGDALANDTFAPSLRNIPAYQVAEALRIGPANMPVFTGNLTDTQLRDVVDYVVKRIQHPQDPGGLGLGGLGPVGEGFIGLALGVGLLALVGFWVGDRT